MVPFFEPAVPSSVAVTRQHQLVTVPVLGAVAPPSRPRRTTALMVLLIAI